MKAIVAVCLCLLLASPVFAESLPSPLQILKKEGQFVFTDGSSYYQLKKDGTFDSGPLDMSGRTIHGHWTSRDEMVFIVRGQWSWVNGVSPIDDYRKMTIAIYTPTGIEPKKEAQHFSFAPDAKVYKCYFVIEELVKIKKPQ